MATAGISKNLDHQHLFVVEIDGFASGEFAECSELSAEIGKVEHFEGGSVIPNKSPGLLKVADITLKRGVCSDNDMFIWFSSVIAMAAAGAGAKAIGLADGRYKRNLDIVQRDRDGTELKRWTIYQAWPVKGVFGKWDNKAEEVVVEELTLTYDYPDRQL
jgi:phage tail-like protein